MTSTLCSKALLLPWWQPRVQLVRFRKRINIQRPAAPHFERAKILAVCKPQFAKPPENISELCLKSLETRKKSAVVENPFEAILAKDVRNWFDHSKFVAFFHLNPMKEEDKFKASMLMRRQGLVMRCYGRAIVTRALADSPFQPVLQLFSSQNAVVFSEKAEAAAKLVKMLRRLPHMTLMAGIVEGRLMSRAQLERYAALPDLQTARAQFVSLLVSAAGARLVSQLSTHQQGLVTRLEQRALQLGPPDTETKMGPPDTQAQLGPPESQAQLGPPTDTSV